MTKKKELAILDPSTIQPQARVFNFGGGRQSMAELVRTAQGLSHWDVFVFCNVGEDSESPETLKYFREYAQPFAEENNITLVEAFKKKGIRIPGVKSWNVHVH